MVPKLVEFDWRVDIKTASSLATTEVAAKSGQQTCIIQLKVIWKFTQFFFSIPIIPSKIVPQAPTTTLWNNPR